MKAKIRFVPVVLFAGMLACLGAQTPLTVAVCDFKGYDRARSLGGKVTTLVTADLTSGTNLVLVERGELNQALGEQAFGLSGMVSSDTASKIGQITGTKVLVAGEVMDVGDNHLVIVAGIIGTETGRLFADKVEGAADNLAELTSDLSRKITQTIKDQTTNLVVAAQESNEEHLERIIESFRGTNRPAVSVNIHAPPGRSPPSTTPTDEFGRILLKAGFPVVDKDSDRKPDIEITGVIDSSRGPRRADLFSFQTVIELKIQDRRTGNIIDFDRQESDAADATPLGASRAAQVNAVDALAERVLPLLAK